MAELEQVSVLESRSAPGVFLAMAWAASLPGLARVLSAWAAGHREVTVVHSAAAMVEVDALRRDIAEAAGWKWVAAENVTEDERIAALRNVFVSDGWLLSRNGAVAWAAAWRIGGVRLVIDFSPPSLPLRLPEGTRVGGIITPQ
jgi:threonine synthase